MPRSKPVMINITPVVSHMLVPHGIIIHASYPSLLTIQSIDPFIDFRIELIQKKFA